MGLNRKPKEGFKEGVAKAAGLFAYLFAPIFALGIFNPAGSTFQRVMWALCATALTVGGTLLIKPKLKVKLPEWLKLES